MKNLIVNAKKYLFCVVEMSTIMEWRLITIT